MTSAEQTARAYCHSIGADPDEVVGGYSAPVLPVLRGWREARVWTTCPRWRWYIGAKIQHKHAAE